MADAVKLNLLYSGAGIVFSKRITFSSSLEAVEFHGMQGSLAACRRVQWDRSSSHFCD